MTSRVCALCLAAVATAVGHAAAQPATLSLAEALAHGRARSPMMAAARARRDAARSAADRAGRWPNPAMELRSENWASGVPGGLPLDLFATVTQTVELGAKRQARRAVADAGHAAATAAEALAGRDLARAISGDYLTALRARDQAGARAEFAAQLAEASRVLQRRVEVGTAPEGDLLRVRTEEARAVIEQTRAELALARALAALGATLALEVGAEALRTPDVPPLPEAGAGVDVRHPELVAAAGAVAAAHAAAEVERTRAVPDLLVNGGFKRTAGFNTGVAAVTVPIALFDRNGVARALADGQLAATEREGEAVRTRLQGALAAARRAAAVLSGRARTVGPVLVEPARGARDAARAAFGAGALDLTRLLDAERAHLEAALVAVDLQIDAVAAGIEARLAAGEAPLP